MMMTQQALWQHVNRVLVAKCISELQYEECLVPEGGADCWTLNLASGARYRFFAWQSLWGQLRLNAESLMRNGKPVDSAAQFFIDAQGELGMDDIVLANLLEECAQTLQGDLQSWWLRQSVSARQMAQMDVDVMQPYLDGHPKAVLNKGRLGWGADELARYAPEYNQPLRLRWVAVARPHCVVGLEQDSDLDGVIKSAMSEAEYQSLRSRVDCLDGEWVLLPVHPWQWQHKIRIHFQAWIARGELVDLGEAGCRYLPLQSIRTLANLDFPQAPNVKLPLTILNTSCYRGIPGHYIAVGARLSAWLDERCRTDPLLYDRGTLVLREPVGITCAHPDYRQVQGAPYRYQEMLGVIWRDSVQKNLHGDERAMLMAGFLQQDNQGDAVVKHVIAESGLPPRQWLRKLFDVVVVPLYHLMCQYGVGLVAHGQNLTLITENGVPKRLAIKDLQGDLRLVDQPFAELQLLPQDVRATLTRLPPEYLIHDLQTGHFVTVLRYLSALLQEQNLLSETAFYATLALSIAEYQRAYPQLHERFRLFDLLTPNIKKVCINRVRFIEGYADRAQRPLPILGTDISNPLRSAVRQEQQEIA